jgi:sRNA-binding protein
MLQHQISLQVIPKVGGQVMILLGRWLGEVADVVEILRDDFQVRVQLASGKLIREEYEHVSKYVGH